MDNEEIIRSEAIAFVEEVLVYGSNDLRTIIAALNDELERYYQPEYKIVYLDESKKAVIGLKEQHRKQCPTPGCHEEVKFDKILFFINQEIDELPKILQKAAKDNIEREKVFISYSHADIYWVEKFKRHWRPLRDVVDLWDDSKIAPGMKWKEEIKAAIRQARIAILFISADFFNSDFIAENELPPLLNAAREDGATILNVFLKPCSIEYYPEIAQYQGINGPKRTMIQMDEAAQELTWVQLVRQVKDIIEGKKVTQGLVNELQVHPSEPIRLSDEAAEC